MPLEPVIEIISILFIATLIDITIGEPPNRMHPVVMIGRIIKFFTKIIKNASRYRKGKGKGKETFEKVMGSILASGLTVMVGVVVYYVSTQSFYLLGTIFFVIVSSAILKTTFSIRAMDNHIREILVELDKNDLNKARTNLSKIVSRDTRNLSESRILSACIECVAESFVDGILSPLFYYGFLNIPGSMMYRTINTLDSMIAYKDDYYNKLGWMSAKLDTILNAIPARLSSVFLIASIMVCGQDWKNAIKIFKRDYKNTESFNAGIPMSIMAGGLNIRLEKIDHYKLGDMKEQLTSQKCKTSLKITKIATLIFMISFLIPVIIILNYFNWWTILFGI
ncbi:MAG: cobalamin biosynthesis protein [Nitrosopumilus sp.]|nr:cobalamin biosynthesis protein [Nitrosopumilus sp.]